jgi:predicted porin
MTTFQRRAELALLGTAAAASFALAISVALPAFGADLGGTCCADLEERVAELEATTARKGNRKVSLTVYGQVSKAMLWERIETPARVIPGRPPITIPAFSTSDIAVVDNDNSPSRVGFMGQAKMGNDWSAGYLIEMGFSPGEWQPSGMESSVHLRHHALWIENKNVGRVTLGWTSQATDGIAEISLANTSVVALATTGLDGGRTHVMRYDSPTFIGFTGAASIANDDTMALALRQANEGGGFRWALGVGYSKPDVGLYTIAGSASLTHVGTGLFGSIAGGKIETDDTLKWHLHAGIERNWSGIGNTTFYGEYARNGGLGEKLWGGGVVQAVDSAALDLFLGVRRIDDVDTRLLAGARIKF